MSSIVFLLSFQTMSIKKNHKKLSEELIHKGSLKKKKKN